MKHIFLIVVSLLLVVEVYAEMASLTLYSHGCDSANVIICPSGQQVRVTAEVLLDGGKFERWSDGNTDNPRLVTVNKDTSLIAIYTTQPRMHTFLLYASGCDTANTITCQEGQQLRVTAEATLDGSRFERWSDGVTDNPRLVTVNGDMTMTAIYKQAKTCIVLLYANGCDSVNTIICPEGQQLRLMAEASMAGSRFNHWSDGVTDNPRLVTVSQDCAFTAVYGNYCGDSLQWEFVDGVLSISGRGAMYDYTQSGQPWNADIANIKNIVFPNGMTHVGNYAFYGLQNSAFTNLVLPQTVETIGAYAFANCNRLTAINLSAALLDIANYAFSGCVSVDNMTCMASTRPDIYENTFKDVSSLVYVYVPCANIRSYQLNAYWNRFDIQCAGADSVVTPITTATVEPTETTAAITWPTAETAATYTITITKDGVVFCTLIFDADGRLTSIAFAPGRGANTEAVAATATGTGFSFTVTGLQSGTHYNYEIDVQNSAAQSIKTHTGAFDTKSVTAVENVNDNLNHNRKVIRNGILLIERNGVYYNAQGAVVE